MCGITGAIGVRDDAEHIEGMTAALRHRGPDGTGYHSRGRHHLGATRLSIVDLVAGVQPIYNETGAICVVFNGEIYNHRQLRADLQRKGHVFRTQTDTEVIVHLYEDFGDDLVGHLDGMFAFAVLDGGRLLLARDPFGIKPLYVTCLRDPEAFLFASEIKAILRHRRFAPRLNLQAVADAIALGYLVGDETYFENIRSLPPGHMMRVSCDGDALRIDGPTRYHTSAAIRDDSADIDEAQAALEAMLDAAVQTHLAADVDVGLTLSGGIDSTLLALLAQRHVHSPLLTFAVADHDTQADLVEAAHVARLIKSTHRSVVMTFDNYLDVIPGLIEGEEQPSSLYGAPFYFLCRTIARDVKAALHGEGADELFGGYAPYIDRVSRLAFIKDRLRLLKPLGIAPSDRAIESIRALASAATFDDYLERLFADNMGDPLERQHLVPIDKCAMASGVEIRVPYLDRAVVELVSRMPFRFLVKPDLAIRKYILRRLIISRFGVGLLDVVLREKLGAPAAGKAHLERFTRLCDEMVPDQYVKRHEFGGFFTSKRELIMFDMFLDVFMTHRGDSSAIGSVIDFIRARVSTGRSAPARAGDEPDACAIEAEVPLS